MFPAFDFGRIGMTATTGRQSRDVFQRPLNTAREGNWPNARVPVMVVMIDYHTDEPAHEIEPQDWLALIRLSEPRERLALRPGWRFLLELDIDRDGADGATVGMSLEQRQAIAKFWVRLTHERLPLALVIRADHDRTWSAAVARVLGEAGSVYVPMPKIEYDRNAYQLLATELRSALRAERRNSVLNRIRTVLGQSN